MGPGQVEKHSDTPAESLDPELSDAQIVRITDAATAFLDKAFDILTNERVLPRSEYRPWIRVARDYYGHVLEGAEGPLSSALQEALPKRFEWRKGPAVDLAWSYPRALLEAAVAAATRAHEPYLASSPAIRQTIDELIAVIGRPVEARVVQIVSDIRLRGPMEGKGRSGDALASEVAGVRIVEVGSSSERFVEREIPGAGFEIDRSAAFAYPGATSLIIADAKGMEGWENLDRTARTQLRRFLSAVRLTSGCTAAPLVEIRGQPSMVHAVSPSVTPISSAGYWRMAYRDVVLNDDAALGLTRMIELQRELIEDSESKTSSPPVVALGRLNRSLDGSAPEFADQVVDLAVGLEAALSSADERTEISLRLRSRAANLLMQPDDPPSTVYRDVKALYEIRSSIVHGEPMKISKLNRLIADVASGGSTLLGEQFVLALDRWRDILRRAILARIALSRVSPPRWPANKDSDPDEELIDETSRLAWQDSVADFWGEIGLAGALLRASPPEGVIGGPRDS